MPDDQNTTPAESENIQAKKQTPTPEENSISPSPHPFDSAQDLTERPTEQGTENTVYSEPTEAPSEALESSPNDFSVKSNKI